MVETQTEPFNTEINFLETARNYLDRLLTQHNLAPTSRRTIISKFNLYMDTADVFPEHRIPNEIGFSWRQIALSYSELSPIAIIAEKLLSSAVSETSCERTISSQRLINTSRRRSSTQTTLDARLTIMRASVKKHKNKIKIK